MPDTLELLSAKAIHLAEKHLAQQHGLQVRIGAEMEYTLLPNHRSKVGKEKKSDILTRMEAMTKSLDFSPSQHRAANDKALFFEESPIISSHYAELASNQFEVVFSHQRNYPSNSILARAIEKTRDVICRSAPQHGFTADFSPVSAIEIPPPEYMRNFAKAVSKRGTNNIDLNISLHKSDDPDSQHPLNKQHDLTAISNHMTPYIIENMALIAKNDEAFERFHLENQMLAGSPKASSNANSAKTCGSDDSLRLEHKTTSANANPMHSIALHMAALVFAIEQHTHNAPLPEKTTTIAKNLKEATQRMEHSDLLCNTLNSIDPNKKLGTIYKQEALNNAQHNLNHPFASLAPRSR